MEKISFTKAGKTSQSSHPTFALWVPRMMKRATTTAVQTMGRMVAAVYRNGGVTRREAMIQIISDKENQYQNRGEKKLARRRELFCGRNRMFIKCTENGLKGTPAENSIRTQPYLPR